MSDSTTPSLDQLPLEVLHRIFYYLDIPDIGRIRGVSRYLNEATYYRNVWKDIYHTTEFIRPPGPFPSQSARDLESVLVSSLRVDRNLHRRERRIPKLRRIRHRGVEINVNLVFGRFLLIAFLDVVRCYDLNLPNSRASVIYRSAGEKILEFTCVSAVDCEGCPIVCAVLNVEMQRTRRISIYSLNVAGTSRLSLNLLHQFEGTSSELYVDSVHLGPRAIIIQAQMGRVVFAMDVCARALFQIPDFCRAMLQAAEITEDTPIDHSIMPTSISTSTHLLLASSYSFEATGGWRTFFQAFALPPDIRPSFTSTSIPLRPSHSGIIFGIQVDGTVLLQDCVLDPTTRDVLIGIEVNAFEPSSSYHSVTKHGILRLSAAPMPHDHEVGTISFQPLGSFTHHSRTPFAHPSFNGTGRVFYVSKRGSRVSGLGYNINASGNDDREQAARLVRYPSMLTFPSPPTILDYDPHSCWICIRPPMKYNVVDVYNLAA